MTRLQVLIILLFLFAGFACEKDIPDRDNYSAPQASASLDTEKTGNLLQQYPNLLLIYNEFEPTLASTYGDVFRKKFGTPLWEQSLISNDQNRIIESPPSALEIINANITVSPSGSHLAQQIIVPFAT